MSKVTLDDVASGYNLSKINSNFQLIEDELNNKVLYRDNPDGEVNQLESDVDVNGKRIYNVPTPEGDTDAASKIYVDTIAGASRIATLEGLLDEANAAVESANATSLLAAEAALTANNAASSAAATLATITESTDPFPQYLTPAEGDVRYDPLGAASSAVAALVGSAPTTLDTLNELATALGSDPSFATTVSSTLGTHTSQITELNAPAVISLGSTSSTATANMASGSFFTATSTGNTTWTFSGAVASGRVSQFTLELTNGGAYTQIWPGSVVWMGPSPALKASGVDVLEFYTRDGGTTWRGFHSGGH